MKLSQVLEAIASSARFNISKNEILSSQAQDIREIIINGDSALLKSRLSNGSIQADRTTVFQV